MSFWKSSISIMKCDHKYSSCFSIVLGYPGLIVIVVLGSDSAMVPWFLLVMILCLPFAIWFSLVLVDLAVSEYVLSVLKGFVSIFLVFLFSLCFQVCMNELLREQFSCALRLLQIPNALSAAGSQMP